MILRPALLFWILVLVALPTGSHIRGEEAAGGDADEVQAARIAALEKQLAGATLAGHFTVTGAKDFEPATERYQLGKVKHLEGESWLIESRITYGEHDVTLPLTLPIRWAGDTPMICVDGIGFPGLGTYTARVFFFKDHYAGTWTGADHGGHLFGVIEPGKTEGGAEEKAVEAKTPSAAAK